MVCDTVGAAAYLALPVWLAVTITVPTPVIVSVVPLTVAGPEVTLKVTVNPEVAVADSVIGETGYVTGEVGAVKLIVCDASLTTIVCDTEGAGE
jgi:hypothetical protein